jgi:hypothetical protein
LHLTLPRTTWDFMKLVHDQLDNSEAINVHNILDFLKLVHAQLDNSEAINVHNILDFLKLVHAQLDNSIISLTMVVSKMAFKC